MKLIAKFSRNGAACYMSHLDLLRCVQRTLRRANIPLAYSQGFNPHPILSFAQAMGVGLETEGDYFEVGLSEQMDPTEFVETFNRTATPGVHVLQARYAEEREKTIMSQVVAASYRFSVEPSKEKQSIKALTELMDATEYLFEKKTKSGINTENMRPRIFQARYSDGCIEALLSCGNDNLQPKAFWQAICQLSGNEEPAHMVRTELWRKGPEGYEPLAQTPGIGPQI